VSKRIKRTPKNYDGAGVTTHKMTDLLPVVLETIGEAYKERPDLIMASWPSIIGPQIASMTQPVSFIDGVLVVKVKNSTLHSLLSKKDKPRILNLLKMKFPKTRIKNVFFRIG
jgi:hypothetical protein